eukprot:NODE_10_length_47437_cov_0.363429.p16 type:complete len:237 gc:universal NODE_10_length_47437_cov_0.363429:18271-17561(-)
MPLITIQRPRQYFIEFEMVKIPEELLTLMFNSDVNKDGFDLGKMNIVDVNDHVINNTIDSIVYDYKYKISFTLNTLVHDKKEIEFAKNHFIKYGAAHTKLHTLEKYQQNENALSKLIRQDPLQSYLSTINAYEFVVETWYLNGKTTQIYNLKTKKIQNYEAFIKKEEKVAIKNEEGNVLDQLTFNLKLTQGELLMKSKVVLPHQQKESKGVINYVPDEFDDFDEDDDLDVDNDLDF